MKVGIETLEDGFTSLWCINLLAFYVILVSELYVFILALSLCLEEEFYIDFVVNCNFVRAWKIDALCVNFIYNLRCS